MLCQPVKGIAITAFVIGFLVAQFRIRGLKLINLSYIQTITFY